MSNTLASGPHGDGVRVAIVDTGLEICHRDLVNNVEPDASFNFGALSEARYLWAGAQPHDPFNPHSLGDHGTSVAGIVASSRINGVGGRGVAPHAKIRGYNFLSQQASGQANSLGSSTADPNSSEVDIFNMSYGTLGWQGKPSSGIRGTLEHGTADLRSGLGAIYVKAAGNGYSNCLSFQHDISSEIGCRSSNVDPTNNLPYLIVVGGFNADGVRATYASTGSNIWVSAPSGQYGDAAPAIISTDQQGTDRGYDVISRRGIADDPVNNPHGDYISTFNGTSAATPMATGAAAVILSENPDLTWRDVKHILASTARVIDAEIPEVRIAFGGSPPYTFRHGWTQNGAGYSFHNWYGFGAVSLDAAVTMAQTHPADSLGEFVESNWTTNSTSIAIPDFNSEGSSSTISVSGLPNDASIEAVVVQLDGEHSRLSDLGITLTSPAGTESVLNTPFNDLLIHYSDLDWELLSNAFYGENPNGSWKLTVVDAAKNDTGTLSEWSIRFYYGTHQ